MVERFSAPWHKTAKAKNYKAITTILKVRK